MDIVVGKSDFDFVCEDERRKKKTKKNNFRAHEELDRINLKWLQVCNARVSRGMFVSPTSRRLLAQALPGFAGHAPRDAGVTNKGRA